MHETLATNHREALTWPGWAEKISAADTAMRLSEQCTDGGRIRGHLSSFVWRRTPVTSPAPSIPASLATAASLSSCHIAPCVTVCDEEAAALKMQGVEIAANGKCKEIHYG